MSTDIVPFNELKSLAECTVKSKLFPAARTVEECVALMALCHSEGLHPMQAVRRYHIIEGKPTMRSDAMLGSFMSAGGRVGWVKSTTEECCAKFLAPGVTDPYESRWTMADAKRAGLDSKQNWQRYPAQMLRARVISDGVRATMPAIVCGIYTPEEVKDFDAPEQSHVAAPATEDYIDATPAAVETNSTSAPIDVETVTKIRSLLMRMYPPVGDTPQSKAACADKWRKVVSNILGDDVSDIKSLTQTEGTIVLEHLISEVS